MIHRIGLLRAMLYATALLVIIFLPAPGIQADLKWPGVLTTVAVPALAPIIFMVILFDLVMSRVVNKGSDDEHPMLSPKFLWLGFGLALIILLRWLPYLFSLTY